MTNHPLHCRPAACCHLASIVDRAAARIGCGPAALVRGLLSWVVVFCAWWTADGAEVRRELQFPDLPGYRLLACDLHMHTVFSDGSVWPPVRVAEAWRQGLHAIAITDHIEYVPHKNDLPVKHGRSHELAVDSAKSHGVLLVKAAEITRDTPPGHFNALFLQDVKALDAPDLLEVIQRANAQGAFVVWNHQGWQGPEKGRWLEVHTTLYEKKWLHAMEICNGDEYYPDAHRWALEKKLTLVGHSDIHDPDLRQSNTAQDHRTITLAFVKERTAEGLKEALQSGRTLVWWKDQVLGREDVLRPFFAACVQVAAVNQRTKDALFVEVKNDGEADVRLDRAAPVGPQQVVLPARATTLLRIGVSNPQQPVELKYKAANFLVGPETPLSVTLEIPGAQALTR